MNNKKEKNRFYYVFALSNYIPAYAYKFLFSTFIHMIFKILPVLLSFLTAYIIGAALTGKIQEAKMVFPYILLLILGDGIFYYLDIYISHDIAFRILTQLRENAYKVIERISPAAMLGKKSGDIISIIMDDITVLEWFYAHTLGQWLVAIILPIAAFMIIACFSYKIALAILPFALFLFFVPSVYIEKSDFQGRELRKELGKLNAVIVDGVQGIMDIASFKWHKFFFRRFIIPNERYGQMAVAYAERSAKESAIIIFCVGLAILSFQVVAIGLIINKELDIIWLMPLFSLTGLIFDPIMDMINLSRNYGILFASAKRVFELLQEEAMVKDDGDLEPTCDATLKKLVFKNVSFRYPTSEGEGLILKDVSFEINRGECVALVGASGSGKSTVARLIQRFYDVNEGAVEIDGINIKEFKLSSLRKMITVIPQEIYLFNRNVKENVLLANSDASDDELKEALSKAMALEILEKLTDGMDTIVGEKGLKLSGGEKARIAIAQAFLKDSPILVMDEATANLDSENERKINQAIERLKKGRMTLVIAHRLSTIKSADRVILLKDARVHESGKFDEIFEKSEYFRELIGEYQ